MAVTIRIMNAEINLTITDEDKNNPIVKQFTALRARDKYGCSIRLLPEVLSTFRGITEASQLSEASVAYRLYTNELARRNLTESYLNSTDDEIMAMLQDSIDTKLWAHQLRGVALARVNSRYAFFYDTRTGKTRMSYQIIKEAIAAGRCKRCLVITPSSIIPDWLEDARQFPELAVNAYYKNDKIKSEALRRPCHVLLFSAELISTQTKFFEEHPHTFDMCIFDESSKLKNYKSKISMFMREFSLTVPYFYLLSATPAPNGMHEYYTQMMCVDPYIFPQARSAFKQLYFNDISRDNKYERLVIRGDKVEDFKQRIAQYAIYVDQKVMPVSGKVFKVVEYDLDENTRAIYDSLRTDACYECTGQTTITVTMAAAIRAKLQQVTSGFIIDTEHVKQNAIARMYKDTTAEVLQETYYFPAARDNRISVLLKIMREHDANEKYVIWANYKQEFIDISTALMVRGYKVGILNGESTIADKESIVNAFKHGDCQVIICHPNSVGMGKNFTESHIAIYYSLTDSWEAFKQSCERIAGHITVQPKPCLYYIIIANHTINSVVYKNICSKQDQSYGVLAHLREVLND